MDIKNIICHDIINTINKCITKNEFHNYKYYKKEKQNVFSKSDLYKCESYIELERKLKESNKININVYIKNDSKQCNKYYDFSFNIFYNEYTNNISICL